jgi:guanylate kinase
MTESTSLARKGLMLVLSSPSGAGKTTLARALLASDAQLTPSVSLTTRPRRNDEAEGVDYYFTDEPKFQQQAQDGKLLEHAHVFGYSYGSPRTHIEKMLATGRDVLFDIDWQGAEQLRANSADEVVSIFILPPSLGELERRLRTRGSDSDEVVAKRMTKAVDEISHWHDYDYVLINHEIETCLRQIQTILAAERLKRHRQGNLGEFIEQL